MAQRAHLVAQVEHLETMLITYPEDAWLERDSIQARIAKLKRELSLIPEITDVPRPAELEVLFDGEPVEGVSGIKADFVPQALDSFIELVSARLFESKRKLSKQLQIGFQFRPLMLTGVARGSFGFSFQEAGSENPDNKLIGSSYTEDAVKDAVDLIQSFNEMNDDDFEQRVRTVDRRSIKSISELFDHIAENNAILKLKADSKYLIISKIEVKKIADRAKRIIKENDTVDLHGMLLGIMPLSRRYEFQPEVGKWFDGKLSQKFDHNCYSGPYPHTCIATFYKSRDVKQGSGRIPRWRYELINIQDWNPGEPQEVQSSEYPPPLK
jgi:hypothetical protein